MILENVYDINTIDLFHLAAVPSLLKFGWTQTKPHRSAVSQVRANMTVCYGCKEGSRASVLLTFVSYTFSLHFLVMLSIVGAISDAHLLLMQAISGLSFW